jgi:hypothetical protein
VPYLQDPRACMSLCTGSKRFVKLPVLPSHAANAAHFSSASNSPVYGTRALTVPLHLGSAATCVQLEASRGYVSPPEQFRSALHGPSKRNRQGVCYRVQIWALQQDPGDAAAPRPLLLAPRRILLNPAPQVWPSISSFVRLVVCVAGASLLGTAVADGSVRLYMLSWWCTAVSDLYANIVL